MNFFDGIFDHGDQYDEPKSKYSARFAIRDTDRFPRLHETDEEKIAVCDAPELLE